MHTLSQRGLSLTSFVLFGIAIIMALVYGKAFVGIPYDSYKIGNILAAIIKEDPGSDKEIKKMFLTKMAFERLTAASPNDLTIDRKSGGLSLTITYQQCEDLWKNWSICADMSVTK